MDLAGGTLDLWPLYLFHPGAVTVNMGVNIMTHCRITPTTSPAIVLHSLPRMDELSEDVDSTRHARYWQEAFNGVVMRMALLSLVLGRAE